MAFSLSLYLLWLSHNGQRVAGMDGYRYIFRLFPLFSIAECYIELANASARAFFLSLCIFAGNKIIVCCWFRYTCGEHAIDCGLCEGVCGAIYRRFRSWRRQGLCMWFCPNTRTQYAGMLLILSRTIDEWGPCLFFLRGSCDNSMIQIVPRIDINGSVKWIHIFHIHLPVNSMRACNYAIPTIIATTTQQHTSREENFLCSNPWH